MISLSPSNPAGIHISPQSLIEPERRIEKIERRKLTDTKFLGMGKCIDRRSGIRRKTDMFDREEWDRRCYERLGPGWL